MMRGRSGHNESPARNARSCSASAERESPAAYFLQEQEMTRDDAVNYISDSIKKGDGDTAV